MQPGGRAPRRQRHQPDAQPQPVRAGPELLDEMDTLRSREIRTRLGTVRRAGRPDPLHRRRSRRSRERYEPFFQICQRIAGPPDGRMLLQTILGHPLKRWRDGHPDHDDGPEVHAVHRREIFPGGAVPIRRRCVRVRGQAGFIESHELPDTALRAPLDIWAQWLEAARERGGTSEEVYNRSALPGGPGGLLQRGCRRAVHAGEA